MIRKLVIDNFRGFEHFEMDGLGRVNLIVGTNNCGKTSVLEAIELLNARSDPGSLAIMLLRRGEQMLDPPRKDRILVTIRHLFFGREMYLGRGFSVSSTGESEASVSGRVEIPHDLEQRRQAEPNLQVESRVLRLVWSHEESEQPEEMALDLMGGEGITASKLRNLFDSHPPVCFSAPRSLDMSDVVRSFEQVVLTPGEDLVLDALRLIEPSIERIATTSSSGRTNSPGVVVKCTGIDQRIPLGSMGEGISRMLALALALVSAKGGVLLVDDIDTGLHYSVMTDMWKLVSRTAEQLNVQVFATTHSRDCFESLAAISREDVSEESAVSIQRIERGESRAVAFTEQEIVIAAERGIEVR